MSVGIISACLPVYGPLFARRQLKYYYGYSDITNKPHQGSRSIPLTTRNGGKDDQPTKMVVDAWGYDIEERPFVRLPGAPIAAHQAVPKSTSQDVYGID